MTPDRTDCAIRMLTAITAAARRIHPELGLSFGYIGNSEPRRDDRQWSVFSKLTDRAYARACNVSWGRAATSELGALAVRATLGDLLDWADTQALRLTAGQLFQVNPSAWLDLKRAHAAAWPDRVRTADRR